MNKEFVLRIRFNDRIGLGYEIFSVLKDEHINLGSMEAKTNESMTIKFTSHPEKLPYLLEKLKNINGLHRVDMCDMMPFERREHELTTILNSVSEGVIAVDKKGHITHINQMACSLFYVDAEQVIGKHVSNLLEEKVPILTTLQSGESYHLKEIETKKNHRQIHYLTSGVPILDEKGSVIGAVATIKDFKQVKEIISKVDGESRSFARILFQSDRMRRVIEMAKLVAQGSSTILIRGESGTGKELFARAIHMESPRSKYPFIAINCGALPESLLESELFGYEDGAFTGATKGGKRGLFEQTDKGTLFLDEIGELSTNMQVKLLRVLQEGVVRKVGSNKEIKVDVRIIAATHQNLEKMLQAGQFRDDLYYRLNVIPLKIPPLRERREDIPILAHNLIRAISSKLNKPEKYLTKEAIFYLQQAKWPGNVRQLENTLERIVNVVQDKEITAQDIIEWTMEEPTQEMNDENSFMVSNDSISLQVNVSAKWPELKEIIDSVEREVLERVLKEHGSSRKAGNVLGVSNTTILNKIKKYHLEKAY